jgi:hypothetical protein
MALVTAGTRPHRGRGRKRPGRGIVPTGKAFRDASHAAARVASVRHLGLDPGE